MSNLESSFVKLAYPCSSKICGVSLLLIFKITFSDSLLVYRETIDLKLFFSSTFLERIINFRYSSILDS